MLTYEHSIEGDVLSYQHNIEGDVLKYRHNIEGDVFTYQNKIEGDMHTYQHDTERETSFLSNEPTDHDSSPASNTGFQEQRSCVQAENHKGIEPTLRYRKRALWFLLLYIPFLVIPWALVCVLDVRPLNAKSYISLVQGLSPNVLVEMRLWVRVIRVMNAIAAVVTIPFTSALLAQAAVVRSQKRKNSRQLSLKQLFALADRDWSNVPNLWRIFFKNLVRKPDGGSSHFLWVAAALLLISAIQQPVQQVFVTYAPFTVMSCFDARSGCQATTSYKGSVPSPKLIGWDPYPGAFSEIPQDMIIDEVRQELATVTSTDVQPNLWPESNLSTSGDFFYQQFDHSEPGPNGSYYFAAVFPNGTTTGVLRQRAMRLNSSISCDVIPRPDFPSTCPGKRPFVASFTAKSSLEIRVCVGGQFGISPWAISVDRQDILEEMYIDVFLPFGSNVGGHNYSRFNFTRRCQARTTRGYFELGNWRSDYVHGPLVDSWPITSRERDQDWYDTLEFHNKSTQDYPGWVQWSNVFGTQNLTVAGPLMATAISVFGNGSWFYIAANAANQTPSALAQICLRNDVPYSQIEMPWESDVLICPPLSDARYRSSSNNLYDEELLTFLNAWMSKLAGPEYCLGIGMFFANQAVLRAGVKDWQLARQIWSSPGVTVLKPVKSRGGTIFVSILICVQLLGLAYTVKYIYQVPTWSAALDATSIAQIGAMMTAAKIPPIGEPFEKDKAQLKNMSGLIGIIQPEKYESHETSVTGSAKDNIQLRSRDITTIDSSEEFSLQEPYPHRESNVANIPIQPKKVTLRFDAPGIITSDMAPTFWPSLRPRNKDKLRRKPTQSVPPAWRASAV